MASLPQDPELEDLTTCEANAICVVENCTNIGEQKELCCWFYTSAELPVFCHLVFF